MRQNRIIVDKLLALRKHITSNTKTLQTMTITSILLRCIIPFFLSPLPPSTPLPTQKVLLARPPPPIPPAQSSPLTDNQDYTGLDYLTTKLHYGFLYKHKSEVVRLTDDSRKWLP